VGLKFVAANSARLVYTQARLNGLNFRWGTAAFLCQINSFHDGEFMSTNDGAGTCVDYFYNGSAGLNTDKAALFDGTTNSLGATHPTQGEPIIEVYTKASGTATPRFHHYRGSTATWTHEAGNATCVDGATQTDMLIGSFQDAAASGAFDGVMWAMALWQGRAMADAEVERLARGEWAKWRPDFNHQRPAYDVPNWTQEVGLRRMRANSSPNVVRADVRPPAWFRFDPTRPQALGRR
jgi:hypothetical protein